ncbi:DUF1669 domain-containing protein [bacterium]|nr:DUF1669 domain-containing protein [bacterium]
MKKNFRFLFSILIILLSISCNETEIKEPNNDPEWIKTDSITVLFSPKNKIDDVISSYIDLAQKTINVAIYDFTNSRISNSLIIAKKRGVNVRVYIENKGMQEYEAAIYDELEANGIDIQGTNASSWSEDVDSYRAIMHNKFITIDGKYTITGSYNFTDNAEENNRENVLIIPNEKIAKTYESQFEIYWENP